MSWPEVEAYLEERSLELSPRTIASYRWALRSAQREICKPLSELSSRDILGLAVTWRRNDQLLSHLRNFLRWTAHPLAEKVPHGIPPETRRRLVWYTVAELEAVVEACHTPRERLLIHLACELMLRRIEIERLAWSDLEATCIRVLGKGRHGGKVRRIPYHPYTRTLLSSSCESRPGRSPQSSGTRGTSSPGKATSSSTGRTEPAGTRSLCGLRRSALDKELKRIGARIPLGLQFHALRRTGGRLFVTAGVAIGKAPLEVLNELRGIYGHEDLRTTMAYIGWEIETAGATMSAMPILERHGSLAADPAADLHGPSGMTYHRPKS